MRRLRRFLPIAAAAALVAGGCGSQGAGEAGSGAEVAPASTAVFVALDTRFDDDQWQAAEALLDRFPGGRKAVRDLLDEMAEDGVDFNRDVKPAVGPEVDFVLLGLGDDPDVFVLTQPPDAKKFADLVAKGDPPGVMDEVDGWTVAAESREALDRFEKARDGDSLADADGFQEAMEGLPDEALATLFVNGERLTRELKAEGELDPSGEQALQLFLPGGRIPSFGFAVRAEANGARFHATWRAEGEKPKSYQAGLVSELPVGAFAYLSFNDVAAQVTDALRAARESDEDFDRELGMAELGLGVSVEEDLLPLLEHEGALAVYGPSDHPTITLVVEVDDEARALATLDKIAARASTFMPDVHVQSTSIDGVTAKQVTYEDGEFVLFYAAFDGKLVVTTTEEGIRGLRAGGAKLADDPAYRRAREAAGAPDETAGFVYADMGQALTAFMGLAEADDAPAEARANLEPLGSLFLFGSADDDRFNVEGFLEID